MKWYGICLLAVTSLTACLRGTRADIQNQSTNVILVGSFSGGSGPTEIFFGQKREPLVTTTNAGSFQVEVPRALIETSVDRRLYFCSSSGEAAATPSISDFESGEKQLDPVVLKPQLPMIGTVSGVMSGVTTPVADAEILVGRNYAKTDADGKFSVLAPSLSELPVVIQKTGFVQTRGLWAVSSVSEVREFHLYNRIEPTGSLSIAVAPRLVGASPSVYLEGTPAAAYVRISAAPFTTEPQTESAWFEVMKKVTLSAAVLSQPTLYYQFADKDKKVFSPVLNFTVSAAVPAP